MNIYALRLLPGQDLKQEIALFAQKAGIRAGFLITCVGSLDQAILRLANQKEATVLHGPFEIVALSGTLAINGLHLHIAISDSIGRTYGGHVLEGCLIYTTAEIVLGSAENLQFSREPDPATGYQELVIT